MAETFSTSVNSAEHEQGEFNMTEATDWRIALVQVIYDAQNVAGMHIYSGHQAHLIAVVVDDYSSEVLGAATNQLTEEKDTPCT